EAAEQSGDLEGALSRWQSILGDAQAGSPIFNEARASVDRLNEASRQKREEEIAAERMKGRIKLVVISIVGIVLLGGTALVIKVLAKKRKEEAAALAAARAVTEAARPKSAEPKTPPAERKPKAVPPTPNFDPPPAAPAGKSVVAVGPSE